MATKLSNNHLDIIIHKSENYYILDTYILLSHLSSEVKGKFIIQTYNDNKSDLVQQLKKYISISEKTIYNNLNELIELNILKYDNDLSSWILVDMEKMVKSKKSITDNNELKDLKGYTKIRKFFFSKEFQTMKAREKRLLVFAAKLFDSKSSNSYSGFIMNLLKDNSKWLSVLKTKSKYYGKYIITDILNKYQDIFTDLSQSLRNEDPAPDNISAFRFYFKCKEIEESVPEYTQCELIESLNAKESALVRNKLNFANITLSKKKIMHIVRGISTLKDWTLKERVAQIIVNKYIAIEIHQSREDIVSLPAYLAAVIKSVIEEQKAIINKTIEDIYGDNLNLNFADSELNEIKDPLENNINLYMKKFNIA